jgi:hypothetical protein
MHKNAMKCNKTLSKWCKNKHGASKIIDTLETYQASCLSTIAASANHVRRPAPYRSTAAPSVPGASGSQIVPAVDVEDDAEIEDPSPQDDEDELMFPELVDRFSKQAIEDQYMEDIVQGARFDDTDDEEKDENNDSLILADYEGDNLPTIE